MPAEAPDGVSEASGRPVQTRPTPRTRESSSVPINGMATTLLVARIDQVHHVLTLWVNPNLFLTESANTPALTTGYGDTQDLDTVQMQATGPVGTVWRIDNLQINSDFS